MARKKKSKIPPAFFKIIGILFLTVIVCLIIVSRALHYFHHADYFKIKIITIDPSLQFINKRDLAGLKGQNLFRLNLKAIQRKLEGKYPQVSNIKIIKQFPNQISIEARQRLPFVQTRIKNRILTMDQRGIILSVDDKPDNKLPFISGLKPGSKKIILGAPLRGKDMHTALRMVRAYKKQKALSFQPIKEISVKNLSKIQFDLLNQLIVYVDQDEPDKKMQILGLILSQGKLDLKQTKYIDLRFKEPIIGKK